MLDTTPQLIPTTVQWYVSQEGLGLSYLVYVPHNMKVIGVVTKSRKKHLIAQTHELACTKELFPQVIASGMSAM